jgi:hypothetical protein
METRELWPEKVSEPLLYSFCCIIMIKTDNEMLITEAGRQTEA